MFRFVTAAAALSAMLLALVAPVEAQGLLERLEKRLEGVLGPEAAVPRETEPGYLGISGDDDESGSGVRVLAVRTGSAAEAAGVRTGDLLVSIAGEELKNADDLEAKLRSRAAGERLELGIIRGGKQETIVATLGRRAATTESVPPAVGTLPPPPVSSVVPASPAARPSLGVTVLPVTDDARRRYGLSVRQGALLSAVNAGGAADRAGLAVGAVVVAADGRRIDTPEDLIDVVRSKRPGDDLMLSYYQGGTLFRKTVRLAEAGGVARVAAADEDPTDRPLLRRIERAIEGATTRPAAPPPMIARPADDLRSELDALHAKVEALERRIAELEGRAPPADPDPASDDAETKPPLRLNSPMPPPRPMPEPR
jgi:predicted metalloprotease with PDZ domain